MSGEPREPEEGPQGPWGPEMPPLPEQTLEDIRAQLLEVHKVGVCDIDGDYLGGMFHGIVVCHLDRIQVVNAIAQDITGCSDEAINQIQKKWAEDLMAELRAITAAIKRGGE